MVKGKKKGGMKKMKGGFLPAVLGGVALANTALKTVKPATMADNWLKSQGIETNPDKLSGLKWLSASALKGMRDYLGWGSMVDARTGRSGNQLMGQSMVGGGSMNLIQGEMYGTPNMKSYSPQSTNGISGSGKGRKRSMKL
jgi:hypothetical protein